MLPENIPDRGLASQAEFCAWLDRWQITSSLGLKLMEVDANLPFRVQIISGHRTDKEQIALGRAGRPAAPVDRSTHTECPATGADLWPEVAPVVSVKALFGSAVVRAGLRWGGGSPVGSLESDEPGIPSDWNHVDEGPRM